MCGICGIATTRGTVDPEQLARRTRTMLHRGPDSEGMHVDGPVGLGARRLAIIDLAGGDQPIASEDGSVVVVQNGEIYNYRDLLGELERAGHRFRSGCETCSRSPSGTPGRAASCSHATGSESSRSTTGTSTVSCRSPRSSTCCRR